VQDAERPGRNALDRPGSDLSSNSLAPPIVARSPLKRLLKAVRPTHAAPDACFGSFFTENGRLGIRATYCIYDKEPAARWVAIALLRAMGEQLLPGEHRAFSMLAYVWRGTRDAETSDTGLLSRSCCPTPWHEIGPTLSIEDDGRSRRTRRCSTSSQANSGKEGSCRPAARTAWCSSSRSAEAAVPACLTPKPRLRCSVCRRTSRTRSRASATRRRSRSPTRSCRNETIFPEQ
jgi:hypothetical protein